DTAVAGDDDRLTPVAVRHLPERATHPGDELGPALLAGSGREVRIERLTVPAVALGVLGPAHPVGLARVLLAEGAVGDELGMAEGGGDDLGGLDRAGEDAGVERGDVAQLTGADEPVPQGLGLPAAAIGEPLAAVVAA